MAITMRFKNLGVGFFKHEGKVYFAMPHGEMMIHFPVLNGKISRKSDESSIFPDEDIEVIPFKEMSAHGLEIKPGDNLNEPRFWT